MVKHKKRSVLPIYLIGFVWLGYATLHSFYSLPDYLLCTCLSVAAFVAGKAIFPDKEYTIAGEPEEKPESRKSSKPEQKSTEKESPKTTGNPEIDAIIKERERAVQEMRRLNDNIEDEKISAQIDHLEMVTGKIIDHVVEHPKKLSQIRRFLNYYLPTTMKILNAYDRMDSAGVAGENISATKTKVEKMMDTITVAYDRQLDALFGEEALDISTDITVMENLLAQEGLSGPTFDKQKDGGSSVHLEL